MNGPWCRFSSNWSFVWPIIQIFELDIEDIQAVDSERQGMSCLESSSLFRSVLGSLELSSWDANKSSCSFSAADMAVIFTVADEYLHRYSYIALFTPGFVATIILGWRDRSYCRAVPVLKNGQISYTISTFVAIGNEGRKTWHERIWVGEVSAFLTFMAKWGKSISRLTGNTADKGKRHWFNDNYRNYFEVVLGVLLCYTEKAFHQFLSFY